MQQGYSYHGGHDKNARLERGGRVKHVNLYTDGACIGNPGPGGYGVIIEYDGNEKELSAGFRLTTNNRMELLATSIGLEALREPCEVDLYSDSLYVVNGIEKGWLRNWQANGWRTRERKPVLNVDLWQRLAGQLERHKVSFHWVRGHAGHPENERVDRLAFAAAEQPGLLPDEAFERDDTRNKERRKTYR